VELAEAALEAAAGDEAAPGLADEGGAGEALRFGRREAEEDLLDELFHQRPHADWWESDPAGRELGFGRGIRGSHTPGGGSTSRVGPSAD